MQSIDPNSAIDGDLAAPPASAPPPPSVYDSPPPASSAPVYADPVVTSTDPAVTAGQASAQPAVAAEQGDTYKEDDLIGAAEGVFGKGAEGLAGLIEDILRKQGEPNAYIVG